MVVMEVGLRIYLSIAKKLQYVCSKGLELLAHLIYLRTQGQTIIICAEAIRNNNGLFICIDQTKSLLLSYRINKWHFFLAVGIRQCITCYWGDVYRTNMPL